MTNVAIKLRLAFRFELAMRDSSRIGYTEVILETAVEEIDPPLSPSVYQRKVDAAALGRTNPR